MEEIKRTMYRSASFFLLLALLLPTAFALSAEIQYQPLVVRPLSKPPTLNSMKDLLWKQGQIQTRTSDHEEILPSTPLHLNLLHLGSLAANSTTPEQVFHQRLERDVLRVKSLYPMATNTSQNRQTNVGNFSSNVVSGISQGSGEYFTRLGVGTPPRYTYMILDTGSDIVWLQCVPCKKCYSQIDPIFNPAMSRSFFRVQCGSPICHRLDVSKCGFNQSCIYQVSYGDGSFTIGKFSTETLTFRETKIDGIALGCSHDNQGSFIGAAGLLGLGRGSLSFPSQAGHYFGQNFSYCLVDQIYSTISNSSSAIVFGDAAIPESSIFTPMLTNPQPQLKTFYYIGLAGISVGGTPVVGISNETFRLDAAGEGGVIVDSGTSVTRLVPPAYDALRDAFIASTTQLKRAPSFSLFDTCYDLSGQKEVTLPTVVLHFEKGANLSLSASNYLIPVNEQLNYCFAFAPSSTTFSIIGNIQQQGFRLIFDGANSRIGFTPNYC